MGYIDRPRLLAALREQFQINWLGHHGIPHWARVRANGLMLARETGANAHVVELFAWFHDSRRANEHEDDGHGARGAALAKKLKGQYFDATDEEMDLLVRACQHHSDGLIVAAEPKLHVFSRGEHAYSSGSVFFPRWFLTRFLRSALCLLHTAVEVEQAVMVAALLDLIEERRWPKADNASA